MSIFALQLSLLAGVRVIATSGSNDKIERVIQLGATDSISYRTTPERDRTVRELTGGSRIDLVVEAGGVD
ncbi:MAG TPA: zinc-binding dehydrogenase [Geobacteraceae bacterium]|nr:zinc-binding dehydrogenase [Geobacteraceae bacterium]